jgi:hypothetical protein
VVDDEHARKERAERLREEIDALKTGRPKRHPASPREFTDRPARAEEEAHAEDENPAEHEDN